jgi:hypothetical protein
LRVIKGDFMMKIRDRIQELPALKNCDEVIKTAKVLVKKKNQTTNYLYGKQVCFCNGKRRNQIEKNEQERIHKV